MTNGMFEGLASEETAGLVQQLEHQLIMLTEKDQQFILGCRMHMEGGTPLTEENQAEVKRIAATLTQLGHDTMGGELSPKKALTQLASVRHTLTASEGELANTLAKKVQGGQRLSPNEVTMLFNLYTAKGF